MRTSLVLRCIIVYLLGIAPLLPLSAQKRISFRANTTEYNRAIAPDMNRLIGNVVFNDGSATMYCDSAYYNEKNEDIDAFGNIRIIPDNGSTTLTGKLLHYVAASRIANITGDVVLVSDSATLTTETIFYEMKTGMATYPNKGKMVSGKNTLISDRGAYNKYLKQAYFKKNVVLTNPQYIIHTDTMNYNTVSKTAEFVGPTVLNSNDNDTIYCEKGWHNTNTDISLARQNAWIKNGSNTIKGDTLYYEKLTGLGKAYGNVEMHDTTQDIILRGNYASYSRPQHSGLVTKKALMIQFDKKDSLYLHGDTLLYGVFTELKDTSSTVPDTFKFVKAFHHVKFFRKDLQGKCDSLYYSFKDSTLQFIGTPVLWAEGNQLTSEHMKIFIKNKKMDKMELTNSALIISKEDTAHYNQIKGRNMTGHFKDNELNRMYVKGNGQMIVFHKEEQDIVGIQKTESSDIQMSFKKSKSDKLDLDRIVYINSVQGGFHPPKELTGNDLILKDFIWLENLRPKIWPDIFTWE